MELVQKSSQVLPEDNVIIKCDKVRVLMHNGRYEEASSILENIVILPAEGTRHIHRLFVYCQIHLALESMSKGDYTQALLYLDNAKTYPEHLGTGMPDNADFRLQDYLMAICYDKMNLKDKALQTKKLIADYTILHGTDKRNNLYFGIRSLRDLGQRKIASQLLKDWKALIAKSEKEKRHTRRYKMDKWYLAKYYRHKKKG